MLSPSPLLDTLRSMDQESIEAAAWLCSLSDDERMTLASEVRSLVDALGCPPGSWIADIAANLGLPPSWAVRDEWSQDE